MWQQIFSTNFFGPVALTKALLPAMRAAGRGRIVMVSSQGGVRGMPAIGAVFGGQGGTGAWAESLAREIAPFGLGVTCSSPGPTTPTSSPMRAPTDDRDFDGPYALHDGHDGRRGRFACASPAHPSGSPPALAKALDDNGPFVRRRVGLDARCC